MIRKWITLLIAILLPLFFRTQYLVAQCSMCKATLESELNNGGTVAQGINSGIIYLIAIPYCLVTILGVVVYRQYRKSKVATLENNK